jgi:hypothetical protein
MCDYSLHAVASRPAKVGDRLVTTKFPMTTTCGFAEIGAPSVAVCLMPGTEVAFEEDVGYARTFGLRGSIPGRVARFRQVDLHRSVQHHDALEFPDGEIILVTRLIPGQRATVLQLPKGEAMQQREQRASTYPAAEPHPTTEEVL